MIECPTAQVFLTLTIAQRKSLQKLSFSGLNKLPHVQHIDFVFKLRDCKNLQELDVCDLSPLDYNAFQELSVTLPIIAKNNKLHTLNLDLWPLYQRIQWQMDPIALWSLVCSLISIFTQLRTLGIEPKVLAKMANQDWLVFLENFKQAKKLQSVETKYKTTSDLPSDQRLQNIIDAIPTLIQCDMINQNSDLNRQLEERKQQIEQNRLNYNRRIAWIQTALLSTAIMSVYCVAFYFAFNALGIFGLLAAVGLSTIIGLPHPPQISDAIFKSLECESTPFDSSNEYLQYSAVENTYQCGKRWLAYFCLSKNTSEAQNPSYLDGCEQTNDIGCNHTLRSKLD